MSNELLNKEKLSLSDIIETMEKIIEEYDKKGMLIDVLLHSKIVSALKNIRDNGERGDKIGK